MSIIKLNFLLLCCLITPQWAYATETLNKPTGKVILSISGNITQTNTPNKRAEFDLNMLEQLPQTQINTTTRWTDGQQSFVGVKVTDLLNLIGAKGQHIDATALDGYTAPSLDVKQMQKYNVILAYKRNGNTMRVRDKGPLWMMYPVDDYPHLKSDIETQYKLIWHLRYLHIK